MKVKTMIMIAAICFAIIPMIAFAVLTNIMVTSDGNAMYEEELTNMATAQGATLDAMLTKVHADVDILSAMPAVADFGKNGSFSGSNATVADDEINRFVGDSPVIGSVSLVSSSGSIVAGDNKGKSYSSFGSYSNYKDNVLYFDDIANAEGNGASMFIKKNLGKGTLFVTYSLSGDNSILSRFTSAVTFYSQGSIVIIDPNNVWSSGVTVNTNLEEMYTTDIRSRESGPLVTI